MHKNYSAGRTRRLYFAHILFIDHSVHLFSNSESLKYNQTVYVKLIYFYFSHMKFRPRVVNCQRREAAVFLTTDCQHNPTVRTDDADLHRQWQRRSRNPRHRYADHQHHLLLPLSQSWVNRRLCEMSQRQLSQSRSPSRTSWRPRYRGCCHRCPSSSGWTRPIFWSMTRGPGNGQSSKMQFIQNPNEKYERLLSNNCRYFVSFKKKEGCAL